MKAFAPANISCIFRIYEKESLGVGFTLNKGAVVSVRKSKKTKIFVNKKKVSFPTVKSVIKKLSNDPVEIHINSYFPFGCGFGMSGASALATAYAINKSLSLKKSKKELAMIAHSSEVENKTGLGDVGGQFNGGIMLKTKKSKPLEVDKLRINQKEIYYKIFSPIETKKIINNPYKKKLINKAGDKALKKIKKTKLNFPLLVEISKEFAVQSKLLKHKKVINVIDTIESKKGKASMIMLGHAVFSTIPFRNCKKALISSKGAHLL